MATAFCQDVCKPNIAPRDPPNFVYMRSLFNLMAGLLKFVGRALVKPQDPTADVRAPGNAMRMTAWENPLKRGGGTQGFLSTGRLKRSRKCPRKLCETCGRSGDSGD